MPTAAFNLDEAGEWSGHWWLPDAPSERVPGVLRYDPDNGLVLSLIGGFEERDFFEVAPGVVARGADRRVWDAIHGEVEQESITLLDGVVKSSKRPFVLGQNGTFKQSLRVATALIGAHVADDEQAAFSAVEASLENLDVWAAMSTLEAVAGRNEGGLDGRGTISVKPSSGKSVEVDGIEFRLSRRYTPPSFHRKKGSTTAFLRETVSVRVVPADKFSLSEAIDQINLVQDLVALATNSLAGVIWLCLEYADPGRKSVRRNVAVVYAPRAVGHGDAVAIGANRALFTCESIPFESAIRRWREAHGRLQAAINMILGLRYAPARYIENNLLTAVGAAEVLHRGLKIDRHPMPPEDFQEMRDAMLRHVPEDHQYRYKGVIRNEPNLRDRLHALAARPDADAVAQLIPDIAHWARRTVRARNDLAHEGKTPRHSVEELIAIVDATASVVILNVLHDIGLPPERQRTLVRDDRVFSSAARGARRYLLPSIGVQ